jgi:hypothetical protein
MKSLQEIVRDIVGEEMHGKGIGGALVHHLPRLHAGSLSYSKPAYQANKIGGLMMADGRKAKPKAKKGGLMMADGRGDALQEFHKILEQVRNKHPNLSYRECQKMASKHYHKK